MQYLREGFDYDHGEGCLRWCAPDEDHVYFNAEGEIEPVISPMSRVRPGGIAGRRGTGEYSINYQRDKRCGLRMIWQHVTGELIMGRIRTMNPRDTRFCIENLYVVPFEQIRTRRDRAKNSTVVSYSYDRQQYTVVSLDHYYNKTVLSYHYGIDTALHALKNPVVSFL